MKIASGDIELDVDAEGAGQRVLLLHGWPEDKDLWSHQVPELVANGFQVVVPDLRGFGQSDRPEAADQYGMILLVRDVAAILDSLNLERVHVVGHDVGAALAWTLSAFVPERVDRLVVMSVGHPSAFQGAALAQHEKFWYTLLFQFEGIAERWLQSDDWRNLRAFLADHPDLDRCIANLARPGALTATLNWYRANLPAERFVDPPIEFPPTKASTLAIWSDRDHALTEAVMLASEAFVASQWRYVRLEGVGHFIPLAAPAALNSLLLEFLQQDV